MTGFNSQVGDGHYAIQFRTDNQEAFYFVRTACQCASEGHLPESWMNMKSDQAELFTLLNAGNCNTCGINHVCKYAPMAGEPVRANCPHYVPSMKVIR